MTGWAYSHVACVAATCGLLAFFAEVDMAAALVAGKLFRGAYGRMHRLLGLLELCWLGLGVVDVALSCSSAGGGSSPGWLAMCLRPGYDVVLGLLGIALTRTAAAEFRVAHERVKNLASGPLEEGATVSHSEMVEHAFYQQLNLVQALLLHAMGLVRARPARAALAVLATLPWLWRSRYPVNRFSDNYTKEGTDPLSLIGVLYRLKKYQYLLYKHCLLHGLNASVALADVSGVAAPLDITNSLHFRLYWVGLNTAYVMEFFLQTLVKRRHMSQGRMLRLNMFLMAVCSVAAVHVLWRHVRPLAAVLSLLLNFARRHREVSNFLLVVAAVWVLGC